MTEKNISVLGDQVLVRIEAAPRQTAGGLHVPENAQPPVLRWGEVVAVGPGDFVTKGPATGSRMPMTVAVGERIAFRRRREAEFEKDGEEYTVLNEYLNIVAVQRGPALQALFGNILVSVEKSETAGGLWTPDSQDPQVLGTTISVGAGARNLKTGVQFQMALSAGDRVALRKQWYSTLEFNGAKLILCLEDDVLGVIEEEATDPLGAEGVALIPREHARNGDLDMSAIHWPLTAAIKMTRQMEVDYMVRILPGYRLKYSLVTNGFHVVRDTEAKSCDRSAVAAK